MAKASHIAGIECDGPAADGTRLVVTTRFQEMCALRKKALDWGDPEGVHDMRVASRRLRSALRDFMPCLRRNRLETTLREIKKLADALGGVRDQDVGIMALKKVSQKAPPEVVPGIAQLVQIRQARRKEARKQLRNILKPANLSALQSKFVQAIDLSIKPARRPRKGRTAITRQLTYRQVARATILQRLDELEKLSQSLFHPLEVEPLHKMRIAAKQLRYALELFERCWGKSISEFSHKVAQLQSSLGELHDCDVWIESFGEMLSTSGKGRQKKSSETNDRLGLTAAWLLTYFVKLRTKHFRNSLARWSEWEKNKLSAELRRQISSSHASEDKLQQL